TTTHHRGLPRPHVPSEEAALQSRTREAYFWVRPEAHILVTRLEPPPRSRIPAVGQTTPFAHRDQANHEQRHPEIRHGGLRRRRQEHPDRATAPRLQVHPRGSVRRGGTHQCRAW